MFSVKVKCKDRKTSLPIRFELVVRFSTIERSLLNLPGLFKVLSIGVPAWKSVLDDFVTGWIDLDDFPSIFRQCSVSTRASSNPAVG